MQSAREYQQPRRTRRDMRIDLVSEVIVKQSLQYAAMTAFVEKTTLENG